MILIYILLNTGHYRVTYDDTTWNLIADALLNERESIHHLNRAEVIITNLYIVHS